MIKNINEQAPVKASSEINISAKADTVWKIITDFKNWNKWNSDIKELSINGEVEKGTVFNWKAGPAKITSTIQHIEPPTFISWTGKMIGISAVHVWEIIPTDRITIVKTSESWDGLLVKLMKRKMQKMLRNSLDTGLQYLRKEAERRTES